MRAVEDREGGRGLWSSKGKSYTQNRTRKRRRRRGGAGVRLKSFEKLFSGVR